MAWSGQASQHDTDHGEADKGSDGAGVAFEVASQATVTTDPRERSFDDPPFRQHLKSSSVRSLDDLQPPGTSAPHDERHLLSRIATVGKDALDEGEQSACPAQQMECSIAVLNVGGMNDNVQQETQRVDQDVPLATFDLLARVVARRIEPSPPFCVPFAVCESMIATVGLASRPSCSRTAT